MQSRIVVKCRVDYPGIPCCASPQDDSFYVGIGRERSDKMLMIESGHSPLGLGPY